MLSSNCIDAVVCGIQFGFLVGRGSDVHNISILNRAQFGILATCCMIGSLLDPIGVSVSDR